MVFEAICGGIRILRAQVQNGSKDDIVVAYSAISHGATEMLVFFPGVAGARRV